VKAWDATFHRELLGNIIVAAFCGAARRRMIFFDLDGTLLDDERAIAGGLKALGAVYADVIPNRSETLAIRWRQLLDRHFPRYLAGELSMREQRRARIRDLFEGDSSMRASDENCDRAFSVYLDAYEQSWTCFPDAMEMLASLSHVPLGIITNGDIDQQTRKVAHTGLASFFSVVVVSSEAGISKPDARIFAEACRRAGVAPSEAIYVGDNWNVDIVGGLAAGLRPIWVQREQSAPADFPPAVRAIPALAALPNALRRQ
jgi:putative hydrolase of the HAD superfamily